MGRTLYAVGKIVKVFGIGGEVVVQPMTDSVKRFKKLKTVFVGHDETDAVTSLVERVHVGSRGARVKIAGTDDRNSAERLVGSLLFVDEQDRIRLSKERYFIHDIIGLTVVDEEERTIGSIKDVLRLPAHDVYVVEAGGREVMLPAVKEFIRSIDLKTKSMRVHLIEGMVEEK